MRYFAGVDPGQSGGFGVVDQAGHYIAAARWTKPRQVYESLSIIKDFILMVYVEDINIPTTGEGISNRFSGSANLWINSGIWQGFLIALEVPFCLVPPATWQAAQGLFRWQEKQKKNLAQHSPLSLARIRWPGAPLAHLVDDGKACGLLLADLAQQDHARGISRQVIRDQNQARAKARRAIKKAQVRAAREFLP